MKLNSEVMRNIVFGIEDSLVSTVGLVSGIAFVGTAKATLLLTGAVIIFVEAFSMAVGSLLSDNSVREFEGRASVSITKSFGVSLIMFFSYFSVGFLILIPYLLFLNPVAMYVSIAISIVALFVLGIFSGRMSGTNIYKKGLTMAVIGGAAILIGMAVGTIVETFPT